MTKHLIRVRFVTNHAKAVKTLPRVVSSAKQIINLH
jgi:hypothetical protein